MPDTEWPKFEFTRFNPIRARRSVGAAECLVTNSDGTSFLLWMTEKDIRNNIVEFGRHPALVQAMEAYQRGEPYPAAPASGHHPAA